MFPTEVLAAYLLAALIVVVAPGPDNILAISRGLGQGRSAAAMSSLGAGLGIMVHTIARRSAWPSSSRRRRSRSGS